MKSFEQWGTLSELLKKGSLSFVDLAFAESVLKKLETNEEKHAALLAVLFALSRMGHLTLDIDGLASSLKLMGIEDVEKLTHLLLGGLETFPILYAPEGRPASWVCRFNNHLYLQKNWVCESEILFHLDRLSKSAPGLILKDPVFSDRLNSLQKEAVKNGMQNSLSLLTGGPGTGKHLQRQSLLNPACFLFSEEQKEHFRIVISAPTGKAIAQLEANLRKAIGEAAHIRSGTLHSILGIKASLQETVIQPLFADLILVDECSMIDSKVFSQLLSSVQTGTRLILIGDRNNFLLLKQEVSLQISSI